MGVVEEKRCYRKRSDQQREARVMALLTVVLGQGCLISFHGESLVRIGSPQNFGHADGKKPEVAESTTLIQAPTRTICPGWMPRSAARAAGMMGARSSI